MAPYLAAGTARRRERWWFVLNRRRALLRIVRAEWVAALPRTCVGHRPLEEPAMTDRNGEWLRRAAMSVTRTHRNALERSLERSRDGHWTALRRCLAEGDVPLRCPVLRCFRPMFRSVIRSVDSYVAETAGPADQRVVFDGHSSGDDR